MSSTVCLKLSYRVFREDLSAWVSPLNSDPAVATREDLEYTCKNQTQVRVCGFNMLWGQDVDTVRSVPAVCGPAPGFSAGAAVWFSALVSGSPISASSALERPEIPSQPKPLVKMALRCCTGQETSCDVKIITEMNDCTYMLYGLM